jgi:hypothetical protein
MKEIENMTVEEMVIENYIMPLPEEKIKEMKIELSEEDTLPMMIYNFPWNDKFRGIVFVIKDIKIEEPKEGEDGAQLFYRYAVISNPNNLDISLESDDDSRMTEDNHTLDIFVGRVIESLLDRMSKSFKEEEQSDISE